MVKSQNKESQSTTEQTAESELPLDIHSITTSDMAVAEIRSDLLNAYIDLDNVEGIDFGIQVYRDGPDVALGAGTTWTAGDDSPSILSYHALSVEQVRELASELDSAADAAERAIDRISSEESEEKEEEEDEDKSGKSLIARLLA